MNTLVTPKAPHMSPTTRKQSATNFLKGVKGVCKDARAPIFGIAALSLFEMTFGGPGLRGLLGKQVGEDTIPHCNDRSYGNQTFAECGNFDPGIIENPVGVLMTHQFHPTGPFGGDLKCTGPDHCHLATHSYFQDPTFWALFNLLQMTPPVVARLIERFSTTESDNSDTKQGQEPPSTSTKQDQNTDPQPFSIDRFLQSKKFQAIAGLAIGLGTIPAVPILKMDELENPGHQTLLALHRALASFPVISYLQSFPEGLGKDKVKALKAILIRSGENNILFSVFDNLPGAIGSKLQSCMRYFQWNGSQVASSEDHT